MSDPTKMSPQKLAVSPSEAADMLGVSVSTFYKEVMPFVYGGTILSAKIGRRRVILINSLRAWLESTAQQGGTPYGTSRSR